MTNTIFHSTKFEFKGITIPEFDMQSGKLIRLCVPNFDMNGNELTYNFRFELLNHFEKTIPESKWSKEHSRENVWELLKPMTVENYIIKELNTDKIKAQKIADYLDLDINEKVTKLILGKRKALAIKCDFEKHENLIFDYYGVGVNEIEYLESIVETEIKKDKCGIVIDRLEYNQNTQTNKSINRIEISINNNVYKKDRNL